MRIHPNLPMLLAAALLIGCANPLNEATASRYSAQCGATERAGDLPLAEQACYRAVKNADWGNLSPELKSQYLYNFARIERRLEKFGEAEQLLRDSLVLEVPLSGATSVKVGRRLVELSVNLAAQQKWTEGESTVLRVVPIANSFSGAERSYAKEVFLKYATTLRELGRTDSASTLEFSASSL